MLIANCQHDMGLALRDTYFFFRIPLSSPVVLKLGPQTSASDSQQTKQTQSQLCLRDLGTPGVGERESTCPTSTPGDPGVLKFGKAFCLLPSLNEQKKGMD